MDSSLPDFRGEFAVALKILFGFQKIFLTLRRKLTYGVMVALQILVLSVEVRILVSQQYEKDFC